MPSFLCRDGVKMNRHGGYTGEKDNVLDFSVNINPLGMPEGLKQILTETIGELNRYPEIDGRTALNVLSSFTKIPVNELILGNGAIELIYLFARAVRPDSAVLLTPAFNEYRRALEMNGCANITEFVVSEQEDFIADSEAFLDKIQETAPQAVFICNPCNPTGVFIEPDILREWIFKAPADTIWFIDESFIDFSDSGGIGSEILTDRQIVLLRSLTKFYALPGLRIGYAAGSPEIIRKMKDLKEPWTINALALKAAEYLPETENFASQSRKFMKSERLRVEKALEDIHCIKAYPSRTDFHLIRSDRIPAQELADRLLDYGICVRTCEDFPGLGEKFIRTAVKLPKDNDKIIGALRQITEE